MGTKVNHGVQTLELTNLLAAEFYPICKIAHICEHLCRGPMTSWGKNLSEEPATDDFKTFSGLCHTLVFLTCRRWLCSEMMVGSSEDKWRGEAFRMGGALLEHTSHRVQVL